VISSMVLWRDVVHSHIESTQAVANPGKVPLFVQGKFGFRDTEKTRRTGQATAATMNPALPGFLGWPAKFGQASGGTQAGDHADLKMKPKQDLECHY